jgi:hypothetical protein
MESNTRVVWAGIWIVIDNHKNNWWPEILWDKKIEVTWYKFNHDEEKEKTYKVNDPEKRIEIHGLNFPLTWRIQEFKLRTISIKSIHGRHRAFPQIIKGFWLGKNWSGFKPNKR